MFVNTYVGLNPKSPENIQQFMGFYCHIILMTKKSCTFCTVLWFTSKDKILIFACSILVLYRSGCAQCVKTSKFTIFWHHLHIRTTSCCNTYCAICSPILISSYLFCPWNHWSNNPYSGVWWLLSKYYLIDTNNLISSTSLCCCYWEHHVLKVQSIMWRIHHENLIYNWACPNFSIVLSH